MDMYAQKLVTKNVQDVLNLVHGNAPITNAIKNVMNPAIGSHAISDAKKD